MRGFALFLIIILIGIASTAVAKEKSQIRKFYVTKETFTGSQALTACGKGYHMASLWEIFDTSNLSYNTGLGLTLDDSGSGPPGNVSGWIRTGGLRASQAGFPGFNNCNAWTTESESDFGTVVFLDQLWGIQQRITNISPWETENSSCNNLNPVWCVRN